MKRLTIYLLLLILILGPGCTKIKQQPRTQQKQTVQPKAVYLTSETGGQITEKELTAHPEILVVHSGEDLKKALPKYQVAIWVDKNAVKLIDKTWFNEIPQKSYPTALLGHGSADYAFSLIGGFTINYDIRLSSRSPNIAGFSVWMLTGSPFDKPANGYFLRGYPPPVTAETVLSKTNKLLEGLNPEDNRKIR